ncbi:MAG: hypothetical protein QOF61_3403 [Acidobacteriota bacterium]|jgi:hypothetical protein|nr:hypothetical protein [Acidobacteriota bacterium]
MLLLIAGIIIALAAGSFLLALVSDAFADALSRAVETAFDFVEYRAALRRAYSRRANPSRDEKISYAASLTRAA